MSSELIYEGYIYTAVSTIAPISILMVGRTGCLRTSLCCLCPCICTLVLSRVCVSGRLSYILRRFYLGCQYCLAVCLAFWQSVLSGCLSSTPLLRILSVLHVLSGDLVDILVKKFKSDGSVVDFCMLFFHLIPFIFGARCQGMAKMSLNILAPQPVEFHVYWFYFFRYIVFDYA